LRKEYIANSENELSNLVLKIIHTMIIFIVCCLRHGSRGVQQIQIRLRSKQFGNLCFKVYWSQNFV